MTTQAPLDYVAQDLPKIRSTVPEFADLSDEDLEDLYRSYSDAIACAGWVSGPDTEGFRRWAITSPVLSHARIGRRSMVVWRGSARYR